VAVTFFGTTNASRPEVVAGFGIFQKRSGPGQRLDVMGGPIDGQNGPSIGRRAETQVVRCSLRRFTSIGVAGSLRDLWSRLLPHRAENFCVPAVWRPNDEESCTPINPFSTRARAAFTTGACHLTDADTKTNTNLLSFPALSFYLTKANGPAPKRQPLTVALRMGASSHAGFFLPNFLISRGCGTPQGGPHPKRLTESNATTWRRGFSFFFSVEQHSPNDHTFLQLGGSVASLKDPAFSLRQVKPQSWEEPSFPSSFRQANFGGAVAVPFRTLSQLSSARSRIRFFRNSMTLRPRI